MDSIVHGVAKSQTEQLSLSLHSSQEIVVFTGGSVVKNLLAMQEMLGWEDPLEKGMATHSSILACRIPWTENSLEGYSPRGHKGLDMPEQLTLDIGLYSCDPCVIKIV